MNLKKNFIIKAKLILLLRNLASNWQGELTPREPSLPQEYPTIWKWKTKQCQKSIKIFKKHKDFLHTKKKFQWFPLFPREDMEFAKKKQWFVGEDPEYL